MQRSVGFMGLGLMGGPMASRLVEAGWGVAGWNRSRPALDSLEAAGGRAVAETADLASLPVLAVMLPDLPQIDAAFEPIFARWALEAPQQGTLVVVFSSVSPVDVRAFGERVAQASRGAASVVDAPVSGGQRGAIRGTLSIMVGAEPAQAEALAGLFAPLASTVVRLGPLGSGSLAKACNQLVVGATAAALAEAAVLAETAGLDVGQLFAVLGGGLAGSRVLDQLGPRIVARDYTVTGPARFMAKDLRFVEAAAHDGGARLPLAAAALDIYTRLDEAGLGGEDLAVVHEYTRRASGMTDRETATP